MVYLVEFNSISRVQRPTFYQIRTLEIKRIRDMGEKPQQLARHTSAEMKKIMTQGPMRLDGLKWKLAFSFQTLHMRSDQTITSK